MISAGRMHMNTFPFFAIFVTIIQQDFITQLRIIKNISNKNEKNIF